MQLLRIMSDDSLSPTEENHCRCCCSASVCAWSRRIALLQRIRQFFGIAAKTPLKIAFQFGPHHGRLTLWWINANDEDRVPNKQNAASAHDQRADFENERVRFLW
jgi:hypothetical protein